jgi:hypothetical protein
MNQQVPMSNFFTKNDGFGWKIIQKFEIRMTQKYPDIHRFDTAL